MSGKRVIQQTGYATLLVTSLLLILALVLTLASYRTTLFQIKQANNELEARQSHWIAEGGLECLYGQIVEEQVIPANPQEQLCQLPDDMALSINLKTGSFREWKLQAEHRNARLIRSVTARQRGTGAIQASASVYMRGALSAYVPDPGRYTENGWQCGVLRYKTEFEKRATPENKGVETSLSPGAGFNNDNKGCLSSHQSYGTGKDWNKDAEMQPFEELFGVSRLKHNQVRDNGVFKVLYGELQGGYRKLADCGQKIVKAVEDGNRHIWVEGGCELDSDEMGKLAKVLQEANKPVSGVTPKPKEITLVVHDGLLSLTGSAKFRGVLLHFNQDYTPKQADWHSYPVKNELFRNPTDWGAEKAARTSYYQHGSFEVVGVMLLDSPTHWAVSNESLKIQFNQDVLEHTMAAFKRKYRWAQGSWHDFNN